MSTPALNTREDIERLQKAMAQMQQVELTTKHHFAEGLYCREVFRPEGTTIVGKVHKREHLYMVLAGIVTVIGSGEPQTLEAPAIIVSSPGTKRAVFAHTDATCCTVHRTDSKDLESIERELLEPDETALFDAHNNLKGLLK
jgi:quercetin dioxygenase-like cupin family protein